MKTNIVLVGSLYEKTKQIAEKVCEKFDLYYANIEDIIAYSLFNAEDIKKECGEEYLKKLKKQVLRKVSSFENTLICVSNSVFLDENNFDFFKAYGTIAFLDFSKKILDNMIDSSTSKDVKNALKVDALTYDEKRELCKNNCDVVINLKKDNFELNCKTVEKVLEEYFL